MIDLTKIQDFVYEKCRKSKINADNPHTGCFIKPIEIGLAHFLKLLSSKGYYTTGLLSVRSPNEFLISISGYGLNEIFSWKLLKEYGEQALFKDQSPETQVAIAELLGWKE